MISDREGDDYHDFANRPENVDILTRVKHDRKIETGEPGKDIVLSQYVKGLPEIERFMIDVPAAPGRAARRAQLALRFAPVTINVAPVLFMVSELFDVPSAMMPAKVLFALLV